MRFDGESRLSDPAVGVVVEISRVAVRIGNAQ